MNLAQLKKEYQALILLVPSIYQSYDMVSDLIAYKKECAK